MLSSRVSVHASICSFSNNSQRQCTFFKYKFSDITVALGCTGFYQAYYYSLQSLLSKQKLVGIVYSSLYLSLGECTVKADKVFGQFCRAAHTL